MAILKILPFVSTSSNSKFLKFYSAGMIDLSTGIPQTRIWIQQKNGLIAKYKHGKMCILKAVMRFP
jgi:hypothetical protein